MFRVGDFTCAPTWVYTVGLNEALNQPELIVFDIPQASAKEILRAACAQLNDGTLVLGDGKVWPEGEDHPIVWRKVHTSQLDTGSGWLALALARRRRRTGRAVGLEAFQLVLPDTTGALPWEDGYDQQLRPLQPAL